MNPKDQPLTLAICLRAARKIHAGRETYSCDAVGKKHGDDSGKAEMQYATMMRARWEVLEITDIEEAVKDDCFSIAARDFRVLLLCMAAAACKDVFSEED